VIRQIAVAMLLIAGHALADDQRVQDQHELDAVLDRMIRDFRLQLQLDKQREQVNRLRGNVERDPWMREMDGSRSGG
jgi:hypothetical protein